MICWFPKGKIMENHIPCHLLVATPTFPEEHHVFVDAACAPVGDVDVGAVSASTISEPSER